MQGGAGTNINAFGHQLAEPSQPIIFSRRVEFAIYPRDPRQSLKSDWPAVTARQKLNWK